MVRPTRRLIVDDTPQVRQELRRLLALAGPMEVVSEAADGLKAVAQAAALGPDVVLLDLELPRLEGFTAGREAFQGDQGARPCGQRRPDHPCRPNECTGSLGGTSCTTA